MNLSVSLGNHHPMLDSVPTIEDHDWKVLRKTYIDCSGQDRLVLGSLRDLILEPSCLHRVHSCVLAHTEDNLK